MLILNSHWLEGKCKVIRLLIAIPIVTDSYLPGLCVKLAGCNGGSIILLRTTLKVKP